MNLIESDVPLPVSAQGDAHVRSVYGFHLMAVGDSIFFDPKGPYGNPAKAHASARQYAKRSGFKFTARSIDGGVRIWRIA